MKIRPMRAGIAGAIMLGGFHCFWAGLVALGVAQRLLDFVFRIHMIQPVYVVEPFRLDCAALLILVTSTIGFVTGSFVALVWNKVAA